MVIELDSVIFADNPDPRCPCLLLLDVSYSMVGDSIRKLNEGLQAFQQSLQGDVLAMKRVEVAIVTFGKTVTVLQDFISVGQFVSPMLEASGNTPMGSAVQQGLALLEERKQTYKQHHVQYYRPWLFLITDGAPTDDWKPAAQAARAADESGKVAFFAVGVEGADMGVLAQFSSRAPVTLKGLDFKEMFLWLSQSMKKIADSKPDEQVPLSSPAGWAKV